jgi:CBS domain-containing protein
MDKPTKTAKQLLDMKKQVGFFSVLANSTVKAALKVLSEKNIGAVLVMDGAKLAGIFSERDYARKGELQGRTAESTAIREVMTLSVASVTPDRTVVTSVEGSWAKCASAFFLTPRLDTGRSVG